MLSMDLYECEIWFLTLREEHGLRCLFRMMRLRREGRLLHLGYWIESYKARDH
jgi:hypothetical protein